jgi:serine/threonine-protein kinase RsbT
VEVLPVEGEIRVFVSFDADIVLARRKVRALATTLGFSASDATLLATAISELARNIVVYAGRGEIIIRQLKHGERTGVSVVARDEGPGIPDVEYAMRHGSSTSRSLGLGLPGVRRVVDDFEIGSEVGKGTCVTVRKWTH